MAAVLAAQPPLQGLLEPFHLAGGLGVVGPAGERADPGVTEPGFEQHLEAAQLAGEAQPVVRQHPGGQPPLLGGRRRTWSRPPRWSLRVTARDSQATREWSSTMLNILTRPGVGDHPVHRVDLPPLVRGWRLEPSPRRLRSLLRLRQHEPATHQDPMHRRHRRHPAVNRRPGRDATGSSSPHDRARRQRAACATPTTASSTSAATACGHVSGRRDRCSNPASPSARHRATYL